MGRTVDLFGMSWVDIASQRRRTLSAMWSLKLDFEVAADVDTLTRWEESMQAVDSSITVTPIDGENGFEVDAKFDAVGPMEVAKAVADLASRVVGAVPKAVFVMTDEERERSFPEW